MTDANATENRALRDVWPTIVTLSCIFHVYQAWRRLYPKYLGSNGSPELKLIRNYVKSRIQNLQRHLVEIKWTRDQMRSELEHMAAHFGSDRQASTAKCPQF